MMQTKRKKISIVFKRMGLMVLVWESLILLCSGLTLNKQIGHD